MKRTRTGGWGWGACLLLLVIGAPLVRADEVDDALAKAESRLVDGLWSAVVWCRGKKITGYRHRLCRVILQLDPDHRRARGILKYTRSSRNGPWVQDPDYREPPDWDTAMIPKAEERVQEIEEAYRDRVLEILAGAPDLEPARTERIYARLVDMMPDDATLLEARGFVEHEGRWVLPETLEGERTRKAFQELIAKASVEVEGGVLPDVEAILKKWEGGAKTERRRVYGSVSQAECNQALVNMELGDALCESLFGKQKRIAGPESTILLQSRDEARRLAKRIGASETDLRDLEVVGALHVASGEYLAYWTDPDYRVTGGLRNVVNAYLKRTFRGHERGWITEGLGQRLTWTVTGEHGPGFVSLAGTERQTADDESVDVLPRDPNAWPVAAARVLARDGPRRLARVLTTRLNAMNAGDVLVAYGLAAYMLEARPKQLMAFLKASVKGSDANEVCEETLGADLVTVSWRIRRWLLQIH